MRPFSVDDIPLLIGLALLWIGVPAWIGYKLWSRRKPSQMRADPVDGRTPRAQRERPTQIDAEYGTDYRGPGRKGEPFFQIGGVAFLVTLVAGFLFSLWFSDLIRPWVDWLVPRSPR